MGALSKPRVYLRDDWYASSDHYKQLWAAVLQMAINDCIYGPAEWELRQVEPEKRPGIVSAIKADAAEWIKSDRLDARTFRWTCGVLEMDWHWLREVVLRAAKESGED